MGGLGETSPSQRETGKEGEEDPHGGVQAQQREIEGLRLDLTQPLQVSFRHGHFSLASPSKSLQ